MTTLADPALRAPSLFDSRHRRTTVGMIVVITVAAVEAMAVAAVMPVTVTDLHGLGLYGWAFTGFFLADIVGIVDGGVRCDRRGPARPLVAGLLLFASGLVVAGLAPGMGVFVLGRAVQGYGGGAVIVAVYVLIARVYDEQLRPRAFAALSAAWVLPALVGPAAAGALAERLGWRWVFLGIAPLALVGLLLLAPVLAALPAAAGDGGVRRAGTLQAVQLAVGLALLQYAGQHTRWWAAPAAVAAVALSVAPLRRLLPAGALRARPGLGSTVVLRGLLAASFFGAEAYLPLTLTREHGFGPAEAGLPLTVGALGWAVGSWLQGRLGSDRARAALLPGAFGAVAACVGLLGFVAWPATTPWLALPLWLVGGAGMGVAMPVISVLTLRLSPAHEQGANSAALQISDVTGSIVGIGAGGVLVALTQAGHLSFSPTVAAIDAGTAGVALVGAMLSLRAQPRSVQHSG